MTHAVRTFLALLEVEHLNQLAFAQRCAISHSTITRFIQGRQPTPELLALLCTKWDIPQHGLELLRAHLLDEVERGGRGMSEVQISITTKPGNVQVGPFGGGDLVLERAIEILQNESRLDPDLRSTVTSLAEMIERHRERSADSLRAVAEDPGEFSSGPEAAREILAEEETRRARGAAKNSGPSKRAENGAAAHPKT